MKRLCLVGLASLLVALPLDAQQAQPTKIRQPAHSVSAAGLHKQVEQLQEQVDKLQEQLARLQATVHALLDQAAAKPTNDFVSQLDLAKVLDEEKDFLGKHGCDAYEPQTLKPLIIAGDDQTALAATLTTMDQKAQRCTEGVDFILSDLISALVDAQTKSR